MTRPELTPQQIKEITEQRKKQAKFSAACRQGNLEILKHLKHHIQNCNFDELIIAATENTAINIIEYLKEMSVTQNLVDKKN